MAKEEKSRRVGLRGKNSFKDLPAKHRWIIAIVSFLILILSTLLPIMITTIAVPRIRPSRSYMVGELSDETIYAPNDITYIDRAATEEEYDAVVKSILPHFSYSVSRSILIRTMADDFSHIYSSSNLDSNAFLEKYSLSDDTGLMQTLDSMSQRDASLVANIISECTTSAISNGIVNFSDILMVMKNGYESVVIQHSNDDFSLVPETVALADLLTKETLSLYVMTWLSSFYPDVDSAFVSLVYNGVDMLTEENVSYDDILTQSLINTAKEGVAPVLVEVKKGDVLLAEDKVVTEQMLNTIEEINNKSRASIPVMKTVGQIIYICAVLIFFIHYFVARIRYKYRVFLYTMIVLVLESLLLVADFFISIYLFGRGFGNVISLYPFLLIPILICSITSNKFTGILSAVFVAAIQVVWPSSNMYTFFYVFCSCIVCLYFVHFDSSRFQMIMQCIFSSLANVVITLLFSIISELQLIEILWSLLAIILNTIVAHLVLALLLPILEIIFNIPTSYRLHELSYTDTPALNRLNQVAPGTYNHVMNVSNIAYAAARRIGVNAELVRVGALYHDIGKSEHPEYFIENQQGKNAHDDISSTLSVAVIKSHVKIGVEKAKEIGLPQEVIDIIAEHHGNDLVKYFYNKALKDNKAGSYVNEDDFRYSGRIPSTPESAIVMLSDCVEAATRTIKNPNLQKYDKFISSIYSDKISYKQLNDSSLTITDLDEIKEAMIHQLRGRDHHRIEYD